MGVIAGHLHDTQLEPDLAFLCKAAKRIQWSSMGYLKFDCMFA